jgi:arsenate reductase
MNYSSVTIYYNPRCSKSRAALELLEQHNIEPTVVDYMKEPPGVDTLKQIIALLGTGVRDLMRSHEQVFKDAGLDDEDLTDDELLEALSQCPTLLQRPIVIIDNVKATIGRPPEKILEIL